MLRMLFRLLWLVAVLTAGIVIMADYRAHTLAWLGYLTFIPKPHPSYAA